jgi:hypothetical protein
LTGTVPRGGHVKFICFIESGRLATERERSKP